MRMAGAWRARVGPDVFVDAERIRTLQPAGSAYPSRGLCRDSGPDVCQQMLGWWARAETEGRWSASVGVRAQSQSETKTGAAYRSSPATNPLNQRAWESGRGATVSSTSHNARSNT